MEHGCVHAPDAAKRDALAYEMHLVIPLATGMEKVHWVKWEQIAFILYLESYSRQWVTDAPSQGKNILPVRPRQHKETCFCVSVRECRSVYDLFFSLYLFI